MSVQWPLTGRDGELRLIAEAVESDGQCGVVIAGAAGVGKTRLAGEAARSAAARGWSVKRIVGTATGAGVPLGAVAQWADGQGGTSLAVAQRVIEVMIEADDRQVLLVVDDAHLLDEMSAFVVLQFVLRDLGVVVATVRTGEAVPDAVTMLWKNELLVRLELQPLAKVQSRELLESVLGGPLSDGSADRLWHLTRGNILLLRHLVRQEVAEGRLSFDGQSWRWPGAPAISSSLRDLVASQIGMVSDGVREVVDLVAVAEPIDRRCLARLADSETLEEAERLGLLTTTAEQVRVGNPLYAEIRLADAGSWRLRRLRGYIAGVMAEHPELAEADPIRLGMLWLESDLPPDAEVLGRAAQVAAARLDATPAERLARAAVTASGGDTGAKVQLAFALGQLGRDAEAQTVLDTIPQDGSGTDFLNEATVRALNLMGSIRRHETCWQVIDDALAVASGPRLHQLRTFRAVLLFLAGNPMEVLAVMDTVDLEQLDGVGRCVALCVQSVVLAEFGQVGASAAKAIEGYRVVEETPNDVCSATPIGESHVAGLLWAGYVDEAAAVADQNWNRYHDIPGIPRALAVGVLGWTALARGDLDAARRHLDPAELNIQRPHDVDGMAYRFQVMHAEALARSGDTAATMTALSWADTMRHPGCAYLEPAYLLAQAWAAAAAGRVAAASKLCRRGATIAGQRGQLAREVLCLQTAVQFGDTSVAVRLDELVPLVEGPRVSNAARYAQALANHDGDTLESVSRDFEVLGDRLAAADAAGHAALVHRANGKRGSALTAGARANTLARACGGATSPAIVNAQVVLPLTRREREITLLLAKGLTNQAIADAMCLSVRTVEGHIYRATIKAGVTTRAELAAISDNFNPDR